MKNRIIGLFLFLSGFIVFFYLFPFEREFSIKIDWRLSKNLDKVNIVILKGERIIIEKLYLIDKNQIKYYGGIEDRIRLKQGAYDMEIYLYYPDSYFKKRLVFTIGFLNMGKNIVEVKD